MTTSQESSRASATVLLVDDDDVFRNTMGFDFDRRGWRVLHANHGNAAWDVLQNEKVHLVITDIRMPLGNGVELLNKIRDRDPRIPPVILMTGYTDMNLDFAKDWGAQAVFNKPFDRKALLTRAQEIVADLGFE